MSIQAHNTYIQQARAQTHMHKNHKHSARITALNKKHTQTNLITALLMSVCALTSRVAILVCGTPPECNFHGSAGCGPGVCW
jgi:hypothetical protein